MVDGMHIEDVVVLIDASRSMMRRDFTPTRLHLLLKALPHFAKKKNSIDPNDRIALVTFGTKATKIVDFTSSPPAFIEGFDVMEVSSDSDVADGLALSMQMLVSEIRKIGGKVVRVVLFSDDRLGKMSDRLLTLANAAKGLGIFIDCLLVGAPSRTAKISVMKNLATMTGGDFAYFNNDQAFFNAVVSLASKKDLNDLSGYVALQEEGMIDAPLLSEIAIELRRPNIQEIRGLISNPGTVKCSICYKGDNPATSNPFYAEGRFCPSCGRPMHLHCAEQWANNSPEKTSDAFRCPFCYFLLQKPKIMADSPVKAAGKPKIQSTKFTIVPHEKIPEINGSCMACRVIFLGEYDVYRCMSCGAHYHQPCAVELLKKHGACRKCGRPVENMADFTGS